MCIENRDRTSKTYGSSFAYNLLDLRHGWLRRMSAPAVTGTIWTIPTAALVWYTMLLNFPPAPASLTDDPSPPHQRVHSSRHAVPRGRVYNWFISRRPLSAWTSAADVLVRNVCGKAYLSMELATESEVADIRGSTATTRCVITMHKSDEWYAKHNMWARAMHVAWWAITKQRVQWQCYKGEVQSSVLSHSSESPESQRSNLKSGGWVPWFFAFLLCIWEYWYYVKF